MPVAAVCALVPTSAVASTALPCASSQTLNLLVLSATTWSQLLKPCAACCPAAATLSSPCAASDCSALMARNLSPSVPPASAVASSCPWSVFRLAWYASIAAGPCLMRSSCFSSKSCLNTGSNCSRAVGLKVCHNCAASLTTLSKLV